jgi:RNA polymerase subunit RPABC4/transcription elongation factor Spt4
MKKMTDDWFGAMLIALLIIVSGLVVYGANDLSNHTNQMREWEKEVHTCPICGWTGYVGLMKTTGDGVFTPKIYYCPNCGYELSRW